MENEIENIVNRIEKLQFVILLYTKDDHIKHNAILLEELVELAMKLNKIKRIKKN
jgi:hypothetical protein